MPVRFRCVYCNQLLGISRRKAGTVVRCTNCAGRIVVPEAELEPAAEKKGSDAANGPAMAPGQVFERNDFDDLLRPFEFDEEHKIEEVQPSPAPSASIPQTPLFQRIRFWHIAAAWLTTVVLALVVGYLIGRG